MCVTSRTHLALFESKLSIKTEEAMGYNRQQTKMNKFLLFIALQVLGIAVVSVTPTQAQTQTASRSEFSLAYAASNDGPRFIDAVTATDGAGHTLQLQLWGTTEANGKMFFYIPYKGVNYGVRWSNSEKKFYVHIGYDNWYFWSNTCDMYSGRNSNGW